MTNAARLARHHRKAQLADSVEYLRDWRFQELDDAADPAQQEEDCDMVRATPCSYVQDSLSNMLMF